MLSNIDLFTLEDSLWATPEILKALNVARSKRYRYIRALTTSGLLSPVGNGYFVLGPKIIELDLQIRETDPLLQAAEGVLDELSEATGHSALLCMLFQNSVLCVDDSRVPLCPAELIGRGQRRHLFRGAMSKSILAFLSNHRLRSIYNRRPEEIAAANLGNDWKGFRLAMTAIREDGYYISKGEFTSNLMGAAAPIFNAADEVIGSVGVAWDVVEAKYTNIDRLTLSVKRAAHEITLKVAKGSAGQVLSPRAVG